MAKGKSQHMGVLTLFIVLIVVIVLSTVGMRYIMRAISGFEDVTVPSTLPPSGSGLASDQTPSPDRNTAYLCRSPNGSGQPCPDNMFCDGTKQQCVPKALFMTDNSHPLPGYFS